MGHTLTQWDAEVRTMLGNPPNSSAGIVDADIQTFITEALRRFSVDRPRVSFSDYAGDGTTFDLTLPAGWVHGFSSVQTIEYPQGERQAVFLDDHEFVMYPGVTEPTAIRLLFTTPESGKTTRVAWTLPWPIPDSTAGTDLVTAVDFEAVCHLVSYTCCLHLSSRSAGNTNPTYPSADVSDWKGEEDRWMVAAREHLKVYRNHIGGGDDDAPAMAVSDFDLGSTWLETGKQFLWRFRR